MDDYTDEQAAVLRRAALGAIWLVSAADPGMLAVIKESRAAAKALAAAPARWRQIFDSGSGGVAADDNGVLADLRVAGSIFRTGPAADLAD